jgi:farnesyl-diphosphate farnesyltransferase
LTIPQLPPELARVVSNHYLLCRIVDTIEDEPALSFEQKRYFCDLFVKVISGVATAEQFSSELAPLLSESTIPAEHELIACTPNVIRITSSFTARQRQALGHCAQVMADGMVEFQKPQRDRGLADLPHMDRYCYHVAGIVGETLTTLFCEYSAAISVHEKQMMNLAVSFGQGLQMTNILKDIWDDQSRGACWLPREVFDRANFDLNQLNSEGANSNFSLGLTELIGVAHGHLRDAIEYTLLIPNHERGLRNFCLWAIGMAVLTLRKLRKHPNFTTGNEVKISRRSVKATIFASRLSVSSDWMIRALFYVASLGLPSARHGDPKRV